MNVQKAAQFLTKAVAKMNSMPKWAMVGSAILGAGAIFGGGMFAEKVYLVDKFEKAKTELERANTELSEEMAELRKNYSELEKTNAELEKTNTKLEKENRQSESECVMRKSKDFTMSHDNVFDETLVFKDSQDSINYKNALPAIYNNHQLDSIYRLQDSLKKDPAYIKYEQADKKAYDVYKQADKKAYDVYKQADKKAYDVYKQAEQKAWAAYKQAEQKARRENPTGAKIYDKVQQLDIESFRISKEKREEAKSQYVLVTIPDK